MLKIFYGTECLNSSVLGSVSARKTNLVDIFAVFLPPHRKPYKKFASPERPTNYYLAGNI